MNILICREVPVNRLECVSDGTLISISEITNKYLFIFRFKFFGLERDNSKLWGVIRDANINVTTFDPMRELIKENIIN